MFVFQYLRYILTFVKETYLLHYVIYRTVNKIVPKLCFAECIIFLAQMLACNIEREFMKIVCESEICLIIKVVFFLIIP